MRFVGGGGDEQTGRRAALPEPEDRRPSPAQRLREARHLLARRADPRFLRRDLNNGDIADANARGAGELTPRRTLDPTNPHQGERMTDCLAPVCPRSAVERPPAVVASDLIRHYGEGETSVHALRGVDLKIDAGATDRHHGPIGLGQVHAHAPARRARPPRRRPGLDRRDRGHRSRRRRPDRACAATTSASSSSSSTCCRCSPRRRTSCCRSRSPGASPTPTGIVELIAKVGLGERRTPPPQRALRRPAATRRGRARPRLPADGDVRRRADRQPRLHDERRDPRAHARPSRQLRPDDGDGHPRSPRGGDRRPRALPRRRPASCATSNPATHTPSSPRWRS